MVRIDQISHHILRLAFANSEDKRRWLLTHEVLLFRARFSASVAKQQQYFMQQHGLQFVTVPKSERDALRDELHAVQSISSSKPGMHLAADDKFYRVPFIQALDLVARRQALVRGGFVYVPQAALESLVVTRFRASVCDALPLWLSALPARNCLPPTLRLAAISARTHSYLGALHSPTRHCLRCCKMSV